MSENTIRPLTRKDRKLVTKMFRKVIAETRDSALEKLISSEVPSADEATEEEKEGFAITIANLGVDILDRAIEFLDDDIGEWFADLLEVSMEDFDKMPADIEIDILKQIKERPEASVFFTRAWQSAKVTSLLETGLQMLKEQFNLPLESETPSTTDSSTEQLPASTKTLPSSD